MISNTALWIIAISTAVEAIVIVALLFFVLFILFKIRAKKKNLLEKKNELWVEELKKVPAAVNDILENISDVASSAKKSARNINNSFDKIIHTVGNIDSLIKSLTESSENIKTEIRNSANNLKNSVEKKSSDIYIIAKAAVNVAKNMFRRKNER